MKTNNPRQVYLLGLALALMGIAGVTHGQSTMFGGNKISPWSPADGRHLDLYLPAKAVAGMPTIVQLSIFTSTTQHSDRLVDLATDRDTVIAELALGFDNDSGAGYSVGTMGFWSSDAFGNKRGPKIILKTGDGFTHWFDAARLGPGFWGRTRLEGKDFTFPVKESIPVVGEWSVSVDRGGLKSLHENTLIVREPNPDEKRIVEFLRTEGEGPSWFPDVILQGGRIPEELVQPLPVESRRTVRLIQVLRAAFVSPQEGLDAIYLYAAEDWGYLHALVDLVEYECLRDVDKDKEAETIRARWEHDDSVSVNFRLVDEGLGLIARFHRDVEKRQFVEQLTGGSHQ